MIASLVELCPWILAVVRWFFCFSLIVSFAEAGFEYIVTKHQNTELSSRILHNLYCLNILKFLFFLSFYLLLIFPSPANL